MMSHRTHTQRQLVGMNLMVVCECKNMYFLVYAPHFSFCTITEVSQRGTAGGSQNGVTQIPSQAMLSHQMAIVSLPAPGAVAGPTTNLNIGMDYWGAPSSSPVPVHGKGAAAPGAPSDHWLQVFTNTPFNGVLQS